MALQTAKLLAFYVVHVEQTSIHVLHSTSRFDQTCPPTRPHHQAVTSQRNLGSNILEGTAEKKEKLPTPPRSININPWLVYFLSWNIYNCFFFYPFSRAAEQTCWWRRWRSLHKSPPAPPSFHFPFCLMNICFRALLVLLAILLDGQLRVDCLTDSPLLRQKYIFYIFLNHLTQIKFCSQAIWMASAATVEAWTTETSPTALILSEGSLLSSRTNK